jgi:hypothetical protein|tara:strand:- start:599 stop:982 length:384 start_codon:yes stop_codon:yes gene_type:complete
MMKEQSGLMPKKSKSSTPTLDKIKEAFRPKAALTLEEELSQLTSSELSGVKQTVSLIGMVYSATDEKSYEEHIDQMYPRAALSRKRLYAALLRELMPEDEYTGPPKPRRNLSNEFYNTPKMQLKEQS